MKRIPFSPLRRIRERYRSVRAVSLLYTDILLFSLCLLFTRYTVSLSRLTASLGDLWQSMRYYGMRVLLRPFAQRLGFSAEESELPYALPSTDVLSSAGIDTEALANKLTAFFPTLFSSQNLSDYAAWLYDKLYWLSYWSIVLLPAFLVAFLILRDRLFAPRSGALGEHTRSYRLYLSLCRVCKPPASALLSFLGGLYRDKRFWYPLVLIWLLNFNAVSLGLQFVTYYLYFAADFRLKILSYMLLRLFLDTLILLANTPWWLIVTLLILLAVRLLRRRGLERLNEFEAENEAVVSAMELCSVITGPMGTGKTALCTSMSLTSSNLQRRQAHDILYKYDLYFPHFPWERLEADLKARFATREILSPAAVKRFVLSLRHAYEACPHPDRLYGYDAALFPMKKDLGNRILSIWEAIETYARAYQIYRTKNLSMANYPIRFDGSFSDLGYFPEWNGDFFDVSPRDRKDYYSHMLDQDMLRLGKRIRADNPYAGVACYGTWTNTELAKSRPNQIMTAHLSATAAETNQKNDLYHLAIKLIRMMNGTVDNVPLVRFIGDEQRPMSLPADLRDVMTVVTIEKKGEVQLALPLCGAVDWLYEHTYRPFRELYYRIRHARGDRFVLLQLLKSAVSLCSSLYWRLYNRYGYRELTLRLEDGKHYATGDMDDTESGLYTYRLMFMKDYADRYATDLYCEFFDKKQLQALYSFDELPEFTDKYMTPEQMQQLHDYMLIDLFRAFLGEKETASADRKEYNAEPDTGPDDYFLCV